MNSIEMLLHFTIRIFKMPNLCVQITRSYGPACNEKKLLKKVAYDIKIKDNKLS
jgi:hypothetical protein